MRLVACTRAFLLVVPLLSACYTTRIYVGETAASGEVHHEWQQTFLWGMVSIGKVNADKICGNAGVHDVKTQVGGVGLLAYWLTLGIWTPMHVKVTCAVPTSGMPV